MGLSDDWAGPTTGQKSFFLDQNLPLFFINLTVVCDSIFEVNMIRFYHILRSEKGDRPDHCPRQLQYQTRCNRAIAGDSGDDSDAGREADAPR